MILVDELKNIGLSEKEAKVYLAVLELAQASVMEIADKADVNRATTYVILDSLVKKGLCSAVEHDKKTYYAASAPESLESIFELQKREISEKQNHFKYILSDLQMINNLQKDKPVIKFFEGKQGILNSLLELYDVSKDITDKQEPIRMVYPRDKSPEFFSEEENKKYRSIRLKRNIKSKVLCTSSGEVKSTPDGERLRISPEEFPVSCDLNIYGDVVRIASLGKRLSSVLIKDKEIANTLKSVFDLAWEAAKARAEKDKQGNTNEIK